MSSTNSRWTQGSCLILLSSETPEQLCLVCGGKLLECAVKCGDCKRASHLECTQLPLYHLVKLASSRTAYTCVSCVRGNSKINFTELEAELQHFRRIQSSEVAQASAEPSAPTLSQIPSTEESTLEDSGRRSVDRTGGCDLPDASDDRTDSVSRIDRPRQGAGRRGMVCRFYKNGSCKHGKAGTGCNYEHPKKCFAYIKFGNRKGKGCLKGRNCDFYHPPLCRESALKGQCSRDKCKFQHLQGTIRRANGEQVSGPRPSDVKTANQASVTKPSLPRISTPSHFLENAHEREAFQENVTSSSDPFLELREELSRIQKQLNRLIVAKPEAACNMRNDCMCRRGNYLPSSH